MSDRWRCKCERANHPQDKDGQIYVEDGAKTALALPKTSIKHVVIPATAALLFELCQLAASNSPELKHFST